MALDHIQEGGDNLPEEDVDLEEAKIDDNVVGFVILLSLVRVLNLITAHTVVDASPLLRDLCLDALFYLRFDLRPEPFMEDQVHNADKI